MARHRSPEHTPNAERVDSRTVEIAEGLDLVYDDCGHSYYVIVSTRAGDPEWTASEIEKALSREGLQVWCDSATWKHTRDWSSCQVHEGGYRENAMRHTTVKNLTDSQIRRLRAEAFDAGDYMMGVICDLALEGEIDTDDYTVLDAQESRRIRGMTQADAYVAIVAAINNSEAQEEVERERFGPSSGRTHSGGRHRRNASEYWVWALGKDRKPLTSEGPWGPYDYTAARQYARIAATNGKHDRAVSAGRDPLASSFEIVRVYKAGTGEHKYGMAQRIGAPMEANAGHPEHAPAGEHYWVKMFRTGAESEGNVRRKEFKRLSAARQYAHMLIERGHYDRVVIADEYGTSIPLEANARKRTTVKNLTEAQISRLRTEAGENGDYELAAVCDLALDGEIDTDDYTVLDRSEARRVREMTQDEAYAVIVRAINDAEAQA